MGVKDITANAFLADNKRFADVCNYYLYNGEDVIRPEELLEQDAREILSILGASGRELTQQKWRDVLKYAVARKAKGCTYLIVGIENQSEIHYAMPVRNMIYDALNYGRQVIEAGKRHKNQQDYQDHAEFLSGFTRSDRLTPVITITVYWGADPWDGPRSLHEMLRDETDGGIGSDELRFVSDYRMNLIIPSEITDFHKFRTSVGIVLELLKYSKDKKNMEELVQMHQSKGTLEADAVQVINHFSNLKLDVEKKKGEISMWKAWEDQKMEGRREGALETKIQLVIKKISKGMSVSQIADILEEEEESVQRICDIVAGMEPDYDIVKIREELEREEKTA